MYPTIPAPMTVPAAANQLSFFGDFDAVSVIPQPIPARPSPLNDMPVPAQPHTKPATKPPAKQARPNRDNPVQVDHELLVDDDEPDVVKLEVIAKGESPALILAKRMFLRMMWDIEGKSDEVELDLFGQASLTTAKTSQSDQNRLDALIWLYGLNPDGSDVSIEMVCDMLELDPHRIRRIVGRNMRKELRRVINLLSTMVSQEHAQWCEEKLSDYLDVTGWRSN